MTALTHRIWWKWRCVTSEPGPWKVIQIPPGPLGMLSVGGTMWRVSGPLWDRHHPREARNKACSWSQNQLQLSEWMILYCYWIWKLAFNSQKVTQMSSILHQIFWKKCTSVQSVTLWDASHVLFFSQFSQSREALICWMPHVFFPRKPSLWVSWEFTAWPVHLSLPSSLFSDELALSLPGLSASKSSILFGLIFLNVWSFTLASTEKRIPRTARPSSPMLYIAFFWECSQQPDSSSSPTCHPQNSHWETPTNPCGKKQTY